MLTDNLFDSILIKAVKNGCNRLFIVSGYATAAMAFHHLNVIKKLNPKVTVELIVGMTAQDGLSESNHHGFQYLMNKEFKGSFKCSYIAKLPPVHSKVYVWFKDDKPMFGFVGSANYTQTAFNNNREVMAECSPEECFAYFESLCGKTIYCNHIEADSIVKIYRDQIYNRLTKQKKLTEDKVSIDLVLEGLPFEKVSLLDRNGEVAARSGLNWGQRPEEGREPNQAYIRLPSSIYNTAFFPEIGTHFTVQTDDGEVLICSRAQQNGKAIHTPENNSRIGEYFRGRLGLKSGSFVTKADLERYGRTDVGFYKIENETYYMDFSKPTVKQ
jgi:phosphatidylserine/phosphatidylglycerophosphate/cardiolipin synthase-like enzyme